LPRLFKVGEYIIFFWSNDNSEPIHIHISAGNPHENATKIWLTKNGGFVVEHNKSNIPKHKLNQLLDLLSTEYFFIYSEWKKHFRTDDIKFYC